MGIKLGLGQWGMGPVLCPPVLVPVLLGLLPGLAVHRATMGLVRPGTVRGCREAVGLSGGGGGLPMCVVLSTVAWIAATTSQGVMGMWGLQPRGQRGIGQWDLPAVGCAELPVGWGLGPLGEV